MMEKYKKHGVNGSELLKQKRAVTGRAKAQALIGCIREHKSPWDVGTILGIAF